MLFDEIGGTETRPKNERESIYRYYNSSARAPVAAARDVLQGWFDSFPFEAKADLLGRFKSPIDSQHRAAFWELYLHELFSGLGYTLEPHPTLPDSPKHPDFLVKSGAIAQFYLEAVVAGLPSSEEAGADARLAEILDLVNKMETPGYFLEVQHRGTPTSAPPVRELREGLQDWLSSLDMNTVGELSTAGKFEHLPHYKWSRDGLTLTFRPIPKSARARADARPIGIRMGEAQFISPDQDIRDAIESKAKKYGALCWPLVVAVNVISDHCDETDINNALFGSESFVVFQEPDGSLHEGPARRLPNGIWFGKDGPRNQLVSAVFIVTNLDPYISGIETPLLIHNPYATNPLQLSSYPLPQSVPDRATKTMKRIDGKSATEFLPLPKPWPPAHD
jgi:hypothetical protein